jgi:hypothetical protein
MNAKNKNILKGIACAVVCVFTIELLQAITNKLLPAPIHVGIWAAVTVAALGFLWVLVHRQMRANRDEAEVTDKASVVFVKVQSFDGKVAKGNATLTTVTHTEDQFDALVFALTMGLAKHEDDGLRFHVEVVNREKRTVSFSYFMDAETAEEVTEILDQVVSDAIGISVGEAVSVTV